MINGVPFGMKTGNLPRKGYDVSPVLFILVSCDPFPIEFQKNTILLHLTFAKVIIPMDFIGIFGYIGEV